MMNTIISVRLPKTLAKFLIECSAKESDRFVLERTFNIDRDGDDFVLVATDTYRMACVRIAADEYGVTKLPESGTWYWVSEYPLLNLENEMLIMEYTASKYPNWQKMLDGLNAMTQVGKIAYYNDNTFGQSVVLQTTIPISLDPQKLPILKSRWTGHAMMKSGEKHTNRYRFSTDTGGHIKIAGLKSTLQYRVDYILLGTTFLEEIEESLECPAFDRVRENFELKAVNA